jgi:polyphosphate kinase
MDETIAPLHDEARAVSPPRTPPKPASLEDPALYVNRELSLLAFHTRVLQQAQDAELPLLERVRFLGISCWILDEFFEIRAGGLREQVAFGLAKTGPDGLGPQETLRRIRQRVLDLVSAQYRLYHEELIPQLAKKGIVIVSLADLDAGQDAWLRDYFARRVQPVLTPVGLDPAHPFPRILNKSLNYLISLEGKDAFGRKSGAAVLQAPRILPRLIPLPAEVAKTPHTFVLLSSVIRRNVEELFPGMKIKGCHEFRVTRNSDLWIDEEEVQDLLLALKGELPRRHYGNAVRLEVSADCPAETSTFLLDQFALREDDLYRVDGPVNLHRLEALYDLVDLPELKHPAFIPGLPPQMPEHADIFAVLREHDVLLHHPYQSFAPVVDFVRQAAHDPDVLAIKLTVYRTGAESPFTDALLEAAQAGKEVTAVVELRARFDEAANIELASRLQEAGAKVVYGVVGFKAHAKMILVVRREGDELRRYVHLGTGNYHMRTARQYSDFGLLTSDREIGEDVHAVFQQLTGLGRGQRLHKLLQTPFGLHTKILRLIEDEADAAKAGQEARIQAKMNALIEPEVIRALYRASQAGVKIDLIVRGICCLVPGVRGVSENIRVRSIVGRFLEHHRVFHFHARGEEITLLSSADWMPRNFFRRVEVTFPVEGKKARARVQREGIEVYLEDDAQAWEMGSDGGYARLRPGKGREPSSAQVLLLESMAKRPT